jgi:hypothetical protein
METILHFMYVVAMKDSKAWTGPAPYTPAELAMVGFWNLIIVWLKVRSSHFLVMKSRLMYYYSCYYRGASFVCGHLLTG